MHQGLTLLAARNMKDIWKEAQASLLGDERRWKEPSSHPATVLLFVVVVMVFVFFCFNIGSIIVQRVRLADQKSTAIENPEYLTPRGPHSP